MYSEIHNQSFYQFATEKFLNVKPIKKVHLKVNRKCRKCACTAVIYIQIKSGFFRALQISHTYACKACGHMHIKQYISYCFWIF